MRCVMMLLLMLVLMLVFSAPAGAESEDVAMLSAIAAARDELPGFFKRAAQPQNLDAQFMVKAQITDGRSCEYVWLTPFRRATNGYLSARIASEVIEVSGYRNNQIIQFHENFITDWSYRQAGKRIGSYTACPALRRFNADKLADYEAGYGFDCSNPIPQLSYAELQAKLPTELLSCGAN